MFRLFKTTSFSHQVFLVPHLIIKPPGYAKKVDGYPAIVMLHHGAVFDGQCNAFQKALEDVVHVVCRASAAFLHILRDVVYICGTDCQVIDELWRSCQQLRLRAAPHALDGAEHTYNSGMG
jgi:hypothetical protein